MVFTLLAAEGLELDEDLSRVIATICLTVLLSVLAHGLSADPLSRRYGAWARRTRPTQELLGSTEPRSRRSLQPPRPPPRTPPTPPAGLTASARPSTAAPAGAMPRANAEHADPTTALNAS